MFIISFKFVHSSSQRLLLKKKKKKYVSRNVWVLVFMSRSQDIKPIKQISALLKTISALLLNSVATDQSNLITVGILRSEQDGKKKTNKQKFHTIGSDAHAALHCGWIWGVTQIQIHYDEQKTLRKRKRRATETKRENRSSFEMLPVSNCTFQTQLIGREADRALQSGPFNNSFSQAMIYHFVPFDMRY